MLWRISYDLDLFQDMTTKILASGLGQVSHDPLFLSGDHQTIRIRRSSLACRPGRQTIDRGPREKQVHLRVPVLEDTGVVFADEGGSAGHDGRAH